MQTKTGQIPPKTAPWGGIVERSEAIWIGWIVAPCRQVGIDPQALTISFHEVPLSMIRIDLTYGPRYYWACPICAGRCEAIYHASGRVGCRRCLRLAYVSQSTRPDSEMGAINRLMTRRFSRGRRWNRSRNEDALSQVVRQIRGELQRRIAEMVAAIQIGPTPPGS